MKNYRIAESMEHMQNYGPNGITTFELLSIILGNSDRMALNVSPVRTLTA